MQLGGSVKIHYAEEKVEEPDTKLDREGTDQLPLQEKIETKDWDLLCQTLRCGRAKSNHVRVNIIGNQQAGKTTLVKRLHNMDVQCPDKHQIPTEVFEINEVSSRCKEIDGEKHWDTKREGYMEDLNVQRMAQAMKSVERNQADDTSTADIKEENLDADIMLIVNADENIRGKKQKPLNADKAEKSRVQYMKKILRKKYHTRGERIYFSYWDFAGQSTYYSTHQIFMSPSAVYVLVVDLSLNFKEKVSDKLQFRAGIIKECTVEESLKFWISSIGAFATDSKGGMAPVVIVGTHIDKLRQAAKANAEEEINRKFDEVREILQMSEVECIAVDNTIQNNSDMIALRNRILELGLGVMDEEIPAQWIDLKRRLREIKSSGKAIMTFADLQCLDESMDAPMRDKEKLEAFLGHQHNRGHVICFLHEDLKNLIILEPNILAKFLNNLMRRRDDKEQREMKLARVCTTTMAL
ncbi:uncharacterized protein LOC123531925 [Mercenaria mercenaria]|uniref:uncharacterized protein LOC123531925 n=1 Tax=Mercenaria mercenaria TaxID=6596 RepID=UPI00234F0222|nr:uncharacterized protein LOC123531925 [Mercenaria mercenaria]